MTAFVYGAGGMGREVLAHWRANGVEPSAFIDRCARPGLTVDGLRVISPDAAADEVDGGEVVVALHSPGFNVASVIDALHVSSSMSVRTLWDECRRTGWLPRSAFWLGPQPDWSAEVAAIAAARGLLDDDASRAVFDEQVALRRFGDYRGLSEPTPEDQYMPRGLPRWRQPMRLLDCGAFDGDTIRVLRANGHTIERYVALEPDVDNYARLVARHGGDDAGRLMRVGAYSHDGSISFCGNEGGAAHVDETGTTRIDVVRIDDLCKDFSPTLIKMDIEGAERLALEGATATIVRDRPELAISVYHRIDDLWRIPLQVAALGRGDRFHLRSHAHNGFDTVLYAVAP